MIIFGKWERLCRYEASICSYMYCTNLTTQYAMTKYLGEGIGNLVLLFYDKTRHTSALLFNIYFFKSMCYITACSIYYYMYFYLLTFSQNYDSIILNILSKINPTTNGLKTIYICCIIFISATYIRKSEALHVKIYKFINPLKKKISQVPIDFTMISYNYSR